MSLTVVQIVIVVTATLIAFFFGATTIIAPSIVDKLALSQLPLVENSQAARQYRELPVNITQRIYFFNITNLHAFLENNSKPQLEEVGPYAFTSVWVKNMSWEGELLSFTENRTFFFDPLLSNGTLDDEVYIVDMVHLGILRVYDSLPYWMKLLVEPFLSRQVLTKKKVREALYEGYKDEIATLAKRLGLDVPLVDGKIGFLLGSNGTSVAKYSVFNGLNNTLSELNYIKAVNDKEKLPYYGDVCNAVYGSNGQLIPPSDEPISEFSLFDPLLCRPWPVYYENTTKENGLYSRNYYARGDFFNATGNSTLDSCYEPRQIPVKGIFDASACQHNQDILFSLPHFYGGDPQLRENVSGLAPNVSKHGIRLHFQKYGIVLDFRIRMQVNAPLRSSVKKVSLPQIVYPIFWQELGFEEADKREIEWLVYKKTVLPVLYIKTVTLILSFSFFLVAIVAFIMFDRKNAKKGIVPVE